MPCGTARPAPATSVSPGGVPIEDDGQGPGRGHRARRPSRAGLREQGAPLGRTTARGRRRQPGGARRAGRPGGRPVRARGLAPGDVAGRSRARGQPPREAAGRCARPVRRSARKPRASALAAAPATPRWSSRDDFCRGRLGVGGWGPRVRSASWSPKTRPWSAAPWWRCCRWRPTCGSSPRWPAAMRWWPRPWRRGRTSRCWTWRCRAGAASRRPRGCAGTSPPAPSSCSRPSAGPATSGARWRPGRRGSSSRARPPRT